jgi:DNA-binding NtrC family response regulator
MSPAENEMPEPQSEPVPVVLVVEDEVLIRLATADHLRSCGFKVLEAATGVEAQELIQAGPRVDIVFSDITMPGRLDGVALAQWLHTHDLSIRVILTSGVSSALDAAAQTCANVRAFAPKPYEYDQIVGHIRTALAG